MTENPRYWVWEITNRCNLACAWCYDSSHGRNIEELNTAQINTALDNLVKIGCEVLNISGREPTMRTDLEDIVENTLDHGIRPTLTTNGLRLLPHYENLLYIVDTISVPLDSSRKEINDTIRRGRSGHYESVMDILKYYKENSVPSRLKVNTLIERRNLGSIPDIGYLIPRCDVWRVSRVQMQGDARYVWNGVCITEEEFERELKEIKAREEIGDYAHIGRINYKHFKDFQNGIYPLPIIRSDGTLYFPGRENFEAGLNVTNYDFAIKFSDFLRQNHDIGTRNRRLFDQSYG